MAFTDFQNGVTFSSLSATPANFRLLGGRYGLGVNATWGGGSVTLNQIMPDGTTLVACAPAYTADATALFDLPAGIYQLTIVTATAVQGSLVPVATARNV